MLNVTHRSNGGAGALFFAARTVDAISVAVNSVATVCIFVIMVVVGVDIVGRFFFNAPMPGAKEGAEVLMVIVVMLTMAHAESRGAHIRIEVVTGRLPRWAQRVLNIMTYLVGIALFVMVLNASWEEFLKSFAIREYSSGSVSLPVYPAKFAVVFGSLLLICQFVLGLARSILDLSGPAERVQ